MAVAAALISAFSMIPAPAQQGSGSSVFAQGQKAEKDKDKDKERKERRKEEKAVKRGAVPEPGAGPVPNPVMQPPQNVDETPATPEPTPTDAEVEPAAPMVEETAPPQPRVDTTTRDTSATVLPPPETEAKGVLENPPPSPPLPKVEERPKDIPPSDEPVYFDFNSTMLPEVIAAIGPMVGKNFLLDPSVATQQVTLITHGAIPRKMVMPILEAVLNTYSLKTVETADGHLVMIRPITENKENAPLIVQGEAPPEGFENYEFRVVQVKHAAASEVSQLLTEVGSKEAKVTVYERTNLLLLYGTATSIRKMLELIEQVDVPGFDEVVEFFTLEFTRAEVIAEQIQKVLMGDEAQAGQGQQQGAPQPVVRQPSPVARPQRPGATPGAAASQQVIGAQALTLRITPDERLNALIVVASQPLMERVRDLIEKLDTPTPPDSNNMHVRELLNADAVKVQETLQQLIGGGGGGGSRSTIGAGGGARGATGGSGGGGSPGAVSSGSGASGEVQPFEKNVTIAVYEQTNSLLIIASPQDYKLLDSIISQIDKPQRQVHVEAIIMEVGIGDRFRLAVESAGLTANDYFALNNVVTLANVLAQGPLASLESGDVTNIGIIDGTTELTFPDGEGGNITQEVPNVPLLIQALESMTMLDVLSRPSVTTVDNEQANVVDGQDVPIPTGTQRPLDSGGGQTFGSVFTTTTREELGVKLQVIPQISQGDYVFLDLEVEVSRPIQSTVGIDPNATGLTFSLSKIINKVVVRDGSTGVLGGLISEGTDRSRRQTPILGDIPLLGSLFGRKDYQRNKRNLVVLITPHIVKEGIDYERLTDAEMAKASKANADVLFERGIIKKVSTKASLRSRYRPTEAATNELRGLAPETGLDKGIVEGEN